MDASWLIGAPLDAAPPQHGLARAGLAAVSASGLPPPPLASGMA